MASMSDYLESALANHCLRTSSFTKPTNIYVALLTASWADSQTGSSITEPSGGGYARLSVPPLDANWTKASSTTNAVANAAALSFTASGGDWGEIVGVAICDASSAGNVLFGGPLTAAKQISDNDTLTIAIGALSVTFA